VGQGHTLLVAQHANKGWTLYRLLPETGKVELLLDGVDMTRWW